MTRMVRVAISGETADCCRLLAVVLESRPEIEVVGVAEDWRDLGTLIRSLSPHLLLLDTDSSGDGTVTVLKTVRLKRLPMAIVGLVGEMEVNRALLPHLDAVVLKSEPFDEMLDTLLAAASPNEKPLGTQDAEAGPMMSPSRSRPAAPPTMPRQPITLVRTPLPTAPPLPTPPATMLTRQPPASSASLEGPARDVAGQAPTTIAPEGKALHTKEGDRVPLGDIVSTPPPQVQATQPSGATGTPSVEAAAPRLPVELPARAEPQQVKPAPAPIPAQPPEPTTEESPVAGVDLTTREFLPPAGTVNLIVSPFGSFRSLGVFQQALQGLEGVRSARLRRFHQGTLYMIVRYDGSISLEERLKDLTQFAPRLVSSKPGLLELRVTPGDRETTPAPTGE